VPCALNPNPETRTRAPCTRRPDPLAPDSWNRGPEALPETRNPKLCRRDRRLGRGSSGRSPRVSEHLHRHRRGGECCGRRVRVQGGHVPRATGVSRVVKGVAAWTRVYTG
jgi:hypothetical protein